MNTTAEESFFPSAASKFRDPFLLQSNSFIPKDLSSALDFALFLYHLNPQYKRASQRVAAHFVTDMDFTGEQGDQAERDELYDYHRDGLDIFGAMLAMGEEWACFAGDTDVVTDGGVYPIKELTGKRVNVLSKDGVYRPADFKSFGVQPLMEVTFPDGRSVLATPEHKWEVRNGSGKIVEVTTEELCVSSHRIKRTVAPRPPKNEDYYEGVRHGFVYGDGSQSGKFTTAMFCGEKDSAMLSYFKGHGNEYKPRIDRNEVGRISGLPGHFKSLPENESSASYWYGFVSGLLAADGTVDNYGCAMLTQCDKEALDIISAQLPRIGMIAGPVRTQIRDTEIGGRIYKDHAIHFVTLLKQFLEPSDLLIPKHRKNYLDNYDPESTYGQWTGIKSVLDTDRYEEVFCCEEMETHRIVVGMGILTGQCYGNSFVRIFFPFDRFLIDRREGRFNEYALGAFGDTAKFDLDSMTYEIPDPVTAGLPESKRTRVKLPFLDRRSMDPSRIKIRMIDPRQMSLQMSWQSGHTRYVYRFEEWFIKQIKEGRMYQVNQTPIDMLKAIKNDEDFMFNDNSIYHCKAPHVSGISNNGWGLPETIVNYRSLHNLQIYRCIDETIGLDYMLPFRLFSPAGKDSLSDPAMYTNLGVWSSHIEKLIKARRKDPTKMMAFPFPVAYQEFGASGKELTPKDLIEYSTNEMLDGMGYPSELFRGSMQVQQVPTTLRLFENTFHFLHRHYDGLLRWVNRRVLDYLGREQIGLSLQLPSMADDLEERHIYLQLAAGGEISRDKAYKAFNIKDPVQEAITRMQEDIEIQREQQKIQKDFEREMSAGSADQVLEGQAQGGGAPAQGGGNVTPLDIMSQAEDLAKQWLQVQDNGQRAKLMKQTQASNPTLHAMAKQRLEEYRAEGESQGRASVSQGGQPHA